MAKNLISDIKKSKNLMEEADEKVKNIIQNIKYTLERIAEINVVWQEYCRQTIQDTPKEKLKDLKLPCFKCMKAVFHKLSTEPQIKEFAFVKYLKSNTGGRTTIRHGKEIRTITQTEHLFECEICEGGRTYAFEED